MKVGVFDSGIGGLTVVKSLLEHQLFEEIIYFGDTARVPYGIKDKNTIIRYAIEAVEFFKNFKLDLIIVACNTVSAYALDEMRETSSCPVIGVVEAGILATKNSISDKDSNILILGTKATVKSKAYELGLSKLGFKNLQAKATGLLVPIVEEEIYSGEIINSTFEHYFKELTIPHAVILGCTHFPLLSDALQTYFGKETLLIHSGDAIVEQLEKEFVFKTKYKNPQLQFFASENPEALRNIAKKWLSL
ncbi:MAG: glutamate racemase [Epsilonproteobacteria bacterium]|nr:glutamate racemase [Campylobacterota bacterium]OIO17454.1 MAG: glutamate racemase [Helicobacteraceae bacterium CG1_02_36_14]PIP10694.1 MAG: glutamate racemase [Sulfurimonas sp. CG23_combo_of_CG06-09_8_20_14_all_36_33]PIS25028.1 MAG: glutamate racemase [Sulfurimonas sp. CG08_land_8_20_14_0_20_36_33]PIU35158.1 MAG: glutamate racemase [Sulfurimonas sp. CG07_land_8_20_14_0_80_36_56]PIV03181.1 MAG: glutamate racemase [Sulfurimonas sp. CG03_land_8_20_14_0_80_36_25]PIV36195.1 MAG: glutamate racem